MTDRSRLDEMAAAPAEDAPDLAGADEGGGWDGRAPRLPQPSPVIPLGTQGGKLHFLDSLNQIVSATTKCDKGDLMLWFGNDWLETHFATEGKERWDQRKVQVALVEDCRALGVFSPEGRVFGRGAHPARGDAETLVLHLGRNLVIANAIVPAAKGRKEHRARDLYREPAGELRLAGASPAFYPARPALPAPADRASGNDDGEALLKLLGSWYWVDPEASKLLLLGAIAQMFICGVLPWRSHVWLTAPTASGKSELQKLIRAIHGDWCLHTEDASEAAIRQQLGDDTLPVLIDEAEAHDNPERVKAIQNLMKKASTGAKIHRGGQDHKGHEFIVRSSFILSSVIHAPMRGEDRNRIAILELREVPMDCPPLELELAHWRTMGRRMHRRMIEQWPRFHRTLAIYKRAIAAQRYQGRWQDTYGTLLACADLLLHDDLPDDDALHGDERMARVHCAVALVSPMMARGRVEARTDVERVQLHLLSHLLPGAAGKPAEPVGVWLDRAMSTKFIPAAGPHEPTLEGVDDEARAKLKAYGLRVCSWSEKTGLGEPLLDAAGWAEGYLAIAYGTNKALGEIYRGSDWADGNWIQSFSKVEGAIKGKKVRFGKNGKPDNAILVPLRALQGDEG